MHDALFLLVSGTNIIPTSAPYNLEHREVMHLSPPPEIMNSHEQDMAGCRKLQIYVVGHTMTQSACLIIVSIDFSDH